MRTASSLLLAGWMLLAAPTGAADPYVVCLDPGHPSEINRGIALQNGLREVDVNWRVALAVRDRLRADPGIRVVLTKARVDEVVTNQRRAAIANGAGAHLFLRLHCDTGPGRGLTLYYPDRPGRKDGRRGPGPALRQAARAAAGSLRRSLALSLGDVLRINPLKGESQTAVGGRQGALTGSIFSQAPAVTVEMGYLSHPGDAAFLASAAGTARLADALTRAIRDLAAGSR